MNNLPKIGDAVASVHFTTLAVAGMHRVEGALYILSFLNKFEISIDYPESPVN